jgi:hypothetical protein
MAKAMVCSREIKTASPTDPAYPALLKKTVNAFLAEMTSKKGGSFWMQLVAFLKEQDALVPELSGYISAVRAKVLSHALESGNAGVEAYLCALESDESLDIIERGLQAFPDNTKLWVAYLERLDNEPDMLERYERAVSSVEKAGKADVLLLFAEYLVKQENVDSVTHAFMVQSPSSNHAENIQIMRPRETLGIPNHNHIPNLHPHPRLNPRPKTHPRTNPRDKTRGPIRV